MTQQKLTVSLSSFTFIRRLFSSSLSAIRMVSSAYLRLLIFLPAILIPAFTSSGPVFLMMYPACKLNKQGNSIQPCCTPFPIWNQSVTPPIYNILILKTASDYIIIFVSTFQAYFRKPSGKKTCCTCPYFC